MTSPRFSRRTGWDLAETEWARRMRERRTAGLPIFDLTASNPTRGGFDYDAEDILAALSQQTPLDYDPDPKGILAARQAVADYFADHASTVGPENVFLTTSTSEAYSYLFRLLCDPGDEVLIAQPSYPLFDFLADLNDVRLVPYPLFYDYGWHLDPEALRQKITSRTRAIVVVHPNNPTGHFTKSGERVLIEQLCVEHGLALVVDEVFLDYPIADPVGDQNGEDRGAKPQSFAAGDHPALTFVLSGLSKVAALPQMKVAWMACFGPRQQLQTAIERLEVIADTYLSMNAPVQWAFPRWMAARGDIQKQIRSRVQANLQALDKTLANQTVMNRLLIEAGWYTVLRIPATENDTRTALELLEESGTCIHSGGFFGFADCGWLVASLLSSQDDFSHGIRHLSVYLQRMHEL